MPCPTFGSKIKGAGGARVAAGVHTKCHTALNAALSSLKSRDAKSVHARVNRDPQLCLENPLGEADPHTKG